MLEIKRYARKRIYHGCLVRIENQSLAMPNSYPCDRFSMGTIIKRATSWQNQQNDLCAQRRLRSVWASPPSLIRVFAVCSLGSRGPTLSSSGQWRLWSDWADAQADLSLRWAHRPFCWFCHKAAQRFLYSDIHTWPHIHHTRQGRWRNIHHWMYTPCALYALSPLPAFSSSQSRGYQFPGLLVEGTVDSQCDGSWAKVGCSHIGTY